MCSSDLIYFDSVNVTKIKKNKDLLKFRKQIQMIFQDPFSSLNGRLKVKKVMDQGALVTDDIIIDLVKDRIKKNDCEKGYLFDGFPRTIPQAEALAQENIQIDSVIEIKVEDDQIIARLAGRRVHQGSGRIYHITNNPPKRKNLDDVTGEPLIQRDDDKEGTIKQRLEVYRNQTEPLVNFYQKKHKEGLLSYRSIDGNKMYEKLSAEILNYLENL